MIKYIMVLFLLLLISCSSSKETVKRQTPEAELKEALLAFHEESYDVAKQALYAVTIKYSGTRVAEDAQYYLAETNFKMERFLVAAHGYRQILDRYTASEYAERSQYKEALSYFMLTPSARLDQKYTHEAIKRFDEFKSDWATSKFVEEADKHIVILRNKLAKKEFLTAELYFKMDRWNAVHEYADLVIREFSDTDFVDDAHLIKSKTYIEKKLWVQAEQELELLISKFPNLENSPSINEVKSLISLGKEEKVNG